MKFTATCYCGWTEERNGSAPAAGRMVLRAAFAHRRKHFVEDERSKRRRTVKKKGHK